MKNSSKILWSSLAAVLIAFLVIVVTYRVSHGSDDLQNATSWLMSSSSAKVEPGNGKMMTKTFELADFNEANVGGWFKVIVKPGNKSQVVITMDSNLIEHLDKKVNDHELTIKYPRNLRLKPSAMGEIVINTPYLNSVSLGGKMELYADNLAQDHFEINLAGKSLARISGKVKQLNLHLVGKGVVKSNSMTSESVNIKTAGKSVVKLAGKTNALNINTAGKVHVDTRALDADYVEINSMGKSDITVMAHKKLMVNAVGKGAVGYYGDPSVVKKDSIGKVEVIHKQSH